MRFFASLRMTADYMITLRVGVGSEASKPTPTSLLLKLLSLVAQQSGAKNLKLR
jgi:hypothetical protein